MKYLAKAFFFFAFPISTLTSFAQKYDTLTIKPADLRIKDLKKGKSTYIVYNKKTKESPSERITLVKINVESKTYNNKPAVVITQQWDRDTIMHSAYTILNANDFSAIEHDYYWKRLGYSVKFDFDAKKISFDTNTPDSVKSKSIEDFNESFSKYNLNWHSDLIVFSVLPYKENRVFKINFYDPGFGKAEENFYEITGTDFLANSTGEKIECWVMKLTFTSSVGYQKFWVSKKDTQVLKEEDFFNNSYRYKLKSEVSEDN